MYSCLVIMEKTEIDFEKKIYVVQMIKVFFAKFPRYVFNGFGLLYPYSMPDLSVAKTQLKVNYMPHAREIYLSLQLI